jgi:hypothetical protein
LALLRCVLNFLLAEVLPCVPGVVHLRIHRRQVQVLFPHVGQECAPEATFLAAEQSESILRCGLL